jgi:phage terminase large subunit-like protein
LPSSARNTVHRLEDTRDLILAKVREARGITVEGYNPHTPTPKQQQFLDLNISEAFYGGAAGGGKSDALLMAALQYVHIPGYSALLLRRTFADLALPGAIMDRSHEWLQGKAKWSGDLKKWTFPSGATLTFGYLETEKDKYRYQGAEFQFIGFDELTQFIESQYTYLFSRLRRIAGVEIPLRMRGASNPGGEGHDWVKSRFVEGASEDRIFVPATLQDNPYLDEEAYRESLSELDPVTRAQLEAGDWDVLPQGPLFSRDDFVIVTEPSPIARWVRYYDLAVSVKKSADYTAGALVGIKADGGIQIADMIHWKREWPDVRDGYINQRGLKESGLLDLVEEDLEFCEDIKKRYNLAETPRLTVGVEAQGTQMGFVQDLHRNDKFLKVPLHGILAKGDKKERAATWAARGRAKKIELVLGAWNTPFINQCIPFNGDGVLKDDMVDAVSGAIELLRKIRGGFIEKQQKPISRAEYYAQLVKQYN